MLQKQILPEGFFLEFPKIIVIFLKLNGPGYSPKKRCDFIEYLLIDTFRIMLKPCNVNFPKFLVPKSKFILCNFKNQEIIFYIF